MVPGILGWGAEVVVAVMGMAVVVVMVMAVVMAVVAVVVIVWEEEVY